MDNPTLSAEQWYAEHYKPVVIDFTAICAFANAYARYYENNEHLLRAERALQTLNHIRSEADTSTHD